MKLYYVTFPDAESRAAAVDAVVDAELAACVTTFPVGSVYRWQGDVERADEAAALFKTTRDHADALEERIADLHPYDVPAIVGVDAETTDAYAAYLDEETR